jgi:hypothetical protein
MTDEELARFFYLLAIIISAITFGFIIGVSQ